MNFTREDYFTFLSIEETKLLQDYHLAIIDEMVEKCNDGNAVYDGRKPETIEEFVYVVTKGFEIGVTAFNAIIDAAKKSYPNENVNVNINYRGESFKFPFKAKQIEA